MGRSWFFCETLSLRCQGLIHTSAKNTIYKVMPDFSCLWVPVSSKCLLIRSFSSGKGGQDTHRHIH